MSIYIYVYVWICLTLLWVQHKKLPHQNSKIDINEELAMKWLKTGAMPTDTVKNLFSKAGIMEKFHNSKQSK